MTRRLALAVALALTTVVTFAVVAIGAQAGLFGDGGKDGSPVDAAAGQTPTPTLEPTVVTEYRFIDVTATPGPGDAPSQSGSTSDDDSGGEVRDSGDDGDDDFSSEGFVDDDDDGDEDEHEEDDD
jgi:hypothetical protein